MISFKNYLTEARLAPLYHGTDSPHAAEIISAGHFKSTTVQNSFALLKSPLTIYRNLDGSKSIGYTTDNKRVTGLSLSRSFKFSLHWAINRFIPEPPVVFEFDQQMLSHNYQIRPLSYWLVGRRQGSTHSSNEYEEFVISDKPIPLKFVKRIHVFSDTTHQYLKNKTQHKYPHIEIRKH